MRRVSPLLGFCQLFEMRERTWRRRQAKAHAGAQIKEAVADGRQGQTAKTCRRSDTPFFGALSLTTKKMRIYPIFFHTRAFRCAWPNAWSRLGDLGPRTVPPW